MHVGIVSPCSSGPLADLLPESGGVDLGHSVSVVTLSEEIAEPRILEGPQLTYYVYPTRTKRRMRDLYKIERQGLREGIRLARPDLLHAHWTYEFSLVCLEMGLPVLVTSHDNAFKVVRFYRDLYRLGRLYLQIRVIRRARFLTAVSPYLANSHQWLAKAKIEVVPNCIEVTQTSKEWCYRSSWPIRIATVLNGWQNLKNPKVAIRAFNLLRHKLSDAEMFMYGYDFEEAGPAAQWASSRGLNQNIHFCGFLPPQELQTELKQKSILLHPSLEEACPMAVLEAMALGLPVVAGSKSGGVGWVLDEGRAGFLTDVKSTVKTAQTLLTCIDQPEDCKQKRENAKARVLSLFSPHSVVEQYEKIYAKVLSMS
jgi:glycosyltransferase involved in cell wall biosynthesis